MSRGHIDSDVMVTGFKPSPQLTKASTRKGEIVFEIQVPDKSVFPVLAEYLRSSFHETLPFAANESKGPITVEEPNNEHVLVTYKPDRRRNISDDPARMLQVLSDAGIPVTTAVIDGMVQAFDNLKALNSPEQGSAVAALEAQRGGGKEPGGRGSRKR
jgi:hypothetical protein